LSLKVGDAGIADLVAAFSTALKGCKAIRCSPVDLIGKRFGGRSRLEARYSGCPNAFDRVNAALCAGLKLSRERQGELGATCDSFSWEQGAERRHCGAPGDSDGALVMLVGL